MDHLVGCRREALDGLSQLWSRDHLHGILFLGKPAELPAFGCAEPAAGIVDKPGRLP
ncbi:hypothetical protein [Streptosporangium amethystogenes]|uniref:hypothetical protein n=1 Tax=Streptosporangium amethystogenes TaxID=2002 RepID=UPI0012F95195|nr:hypothetical protein [Streptosporangium amethystogenes]